MSSPVRPIAQDALHVNTIMTDRQCKKVGLDFATPSTCSDFFAYLTSLDGSIEDTTANIVSFPCKYSIQTVDKNCLPFQATLVACSDSVTVDELKVLQSSPNTLKTYEVLYVFMMLLGSIGTCFVLLACFCLQMKR